MLLSIGDFIDLYFQIKRNKKISRLIQRFFLHEQKRSRSWWNHTTAAAPHWSDLPEIVGRWNKKISGNPSTHYIHYVGNTYFKDSKRICLLSIACGTGRKEVEIATIRPDWIIKGFDVSAARINDANFNAQNANARNIEFITSALSDFSFSENTHDIILFDSSLHHFRDFNLIFTTIAPSLTKNGLVVINEYTGPDRFQWSKRQLHAANTLLKKIPRDFRRRMNSTRIKNRIYRPGSLRMILSDPSEAIQSSRILPSLHAHFKVLQETPLGGNLLNLLLKDITHNFLNGDESARTVLNGLFEEEDRFIADNPSDFTFGVYQRAQ